MYKCTLQLLFQEKFQEHLRQNRTQYITVILENIFQARNIAASIRSADCFGIQDVHIIENDNIFNNDAEVSMGAEKWITINRYNKKENNTIQAIQNLKSEGYQIIATTVDPQTKIDISGGHEHGATDFYFDPANVSTPLPYDVSSGVAYPPGKGLPSNGVLNTSVGQAIIEGGQDGYPCWPRKWCPRNIHGG